MQAATLLSPSRWNLCCCASCSKGPENSLCPAVTIKFSPLLPEQLGKGAEESETQEMGVGPLSPGWPQQREQSLPCPGPQPCCLTSVGGIWPPTLPVSVLACDSGCGFIEHLSCPESWVLHLWFITLLPCSRFPYLKMRSINLSGRKAGTGTVGDRTARGLCSSAKPCPSEAMTQFASNGRNMQ